MKEWNSGIHISRSFSGCSGRKIFLILKNNIEYIWIVTLPRCKLHMCIEFSNFPWNASRYCCSCRRQILGDDHTGHHRTEWHVTHRHTRPVLPSPGTPDGSKWNVLIIIQIIQNCSLFQKITTKSGVSRESQHGIDYTFIDIHEICHCFFLSIFVIDVLDVYVDQRFAILVFRQTKDLLLVQHVVVKDAFLMTSLLYVTPDRLGALCLSQSPFCSMYRHFRYRMPRNVSSRRKYGCWSFTSRICHPAPISGTC